LESLRTSHFSVAQARPAEFFKDHRERHQGAADGGSASAKMKFCAAAEIHLQNLNDDLEIKDSMRHYWRQCLAALVKSWPALNETEVRRITRPSCSAPCECIRGRQWCGRRAISLFEMGKPIAIDCRLLTAHTDGDNIDRLFTLRSLDEARFRHCCDQNRGFGGRWYFHQVHTTVDTT
jgi:hypothetical protein